MLKGFVPRLYQETILATAANKNTLVVLPTGMGKTGVALLLAAQRLSIFPESKILILAPTKPLVEQHLTTFKQHLDVEEDKFALFTGEISPQLRAQSWSSAKVIFSTPQGLENDIIGSKVDISQVSLVVFDEAHRATGEYSYVFLAKQYLKRAINPLVLALSASPGSEMQKIEDVCKNLFIEAVEIRTDKDPDVAPYVQEVELEWVKLELPLELKTIKVLLDQCIKQRIDNLKTLGLRGSLLTKRELLGAQMELQRKMAKGEHDFDTLKALSVLAEVMKAQHALELLEGQGIVPLINYFEGLFAQGQSSKVKAVRNLTQDVRFKEAFILSQRLFEKKVDHPKLAKIVEFLREEVDKNRMLKVILFTQFRDSAVRISEELSKVQGLFPQVFVGQAKKGNTGLSQKKQVEMLDQFRDGLFNILIATSVAEEGLDIPKVDIVVFYEPIPSAVRSIQRRGRTGRSQKGRVVVFMTKGTREEAYSWSAKNKEKKMVSALESMRGTLRDKVKPIQPSIQSFETAKVKIFADYREKSDGTLKALVDKDADVKLEMLGVADYVLSDRVAVELKLVADFVDSIIDGRLLEQLKGLKQSYSKPILIIQGDQDIYSVRNVHPNSIRGMLATIAVSYGIPIIQTKNEQDTAELLITIAKREQEENKKEFSPHADRKPMTLKEQQEYLVSALPSVGPVLARELLCKFGSIAFVFAASEKELLEVQGVGEKIARGIRELVLSQYQKK
ncbi:DEAD/DEAH box helicase [Candidatus Woesearchaeota archaeon]|nr:DEAD/DEAH box helicase [Candidatus Woesearchaeota archaeon]